MVIYVNVKGKVYRKPLESPKYFNINVFKDREDPAFHICSDISQETDDGQPTSMVVWKGPLATDNSDITPNVTCQPPSGSNFKIGQTDVICKATDRSGNNASCSFQVDMAGM